MKPQDHPDKTTQTLQEFQREKLKLMEYFYAWLDAGKSLEELEIMIDILLLPGRVPEHAREISHNTLDLIKQAREEGADYTEVFAYVQGLAKRNCLL
jgi:hypothetical protein